jgi:hypothetical protein
MYEQVKKPKKNKSRAIPNSVAQKKGNGQQGFVDNREKVNIHNSTKGDSKSGGKNIIQRYIRAGYIPNDGPFGLDYTNAYNVQHPDGKTDFSQPRKVDEVNKNYAVAHPPAFTAISPQISDSSGTGLVYIDDSSKLTPEVDHIVERRYGGSNDLRNARVVSKKENNDGAPARSASYDIVSGNTVEMVEVKYDQPNNKYDETGNSHSIDNKNVISDTGLKYLLAVNQKHDATSADVTAFNYSLGHLNLIRGLNTNDVNTTAPIDKKDYVKIKSIS